jgi:quinol monooxygenase YgiN
MPVMIETILVTGTITVEPDERDAFIEAAKAGMRTSRAEDGCEEFVLAPDPIEPSRVVLSQRWRDRAALNAHITAETHESDGPKPTSISIEFHTIASSEKIV